MGTLQQALVSSRVVSATDIERLKRQERIEQEQRRKAQERQWERERDRLRRQELLQVSVVTLSSKFEREVAEYLGAVFVDALTAEQTKLDTRMIRDLIKRQIAIHDGPV